MSAFKRTLLPFIAAPLGACMTNPQSTDPALPAGHHFAYSIVGSEDLHLIQAFDDGSHTYLQFDETPAALEVRRSLNESLIAYTKDPHYVVIPALFPELHVTSGNLSATVRNQMAPDVGGSRVDVAIADSAHDSDERNDPMNTTLSAYDRPSAMPPVPSLIGEPPAPAFRAAPIGVPETLQTMTAALRVATLKQEISTLEERMRFLSEELMEAHRTGFGSTLYLRNLAGSPRIAVTFEDNSAIVRIDQSLLGALRNTLKAANRLYLHGHTDAYVASEAGTDLAIRRAVEVRNLLVFLDVEPTRMRLFYRGAGNFVANNSTPQGKALNRRVEIELRKW